MGACDVLVVGFVAVGCQAIVILFLEYRFDPVTVLVGFWILAPQPTIQLPSDLVVSFGPGLNLLLL